MKAPPATCAIFAVLLASSSATLAAASYNVVDLSLPGAVSSQFGGLNDSGQAAANSIIGTNVHLTRFTSGRVVDLSTLNWPTTAAINSNGVIAGMFELGNISPFLYGAGFTNLGMFNGNSTYAIGLNDLDDVVGYANVAGNDHALLIKADGTEHDLGALDVSSTSRATGINNNRWIVGWSYAQTNTTFRAFLVTNSVMLDPGIGNGSEAWAINGAGVMVGDIATGGRVAFVYSNGIVTRLGALAPNRATSALAINNQGQIVGYSTQTNNAQHAVLFNGTAAPTDLNPLAANTNYVLTSARAMNALGEIVCDGVYQGGNSHSVLLVPTSFLNIDVQPFPAQTARNGDAVSMSVGASGLAPITYQWFFNGSAVPGATGATLTVSNLSDANVGSYTVEVHNDYATLLSYPSAVALLDINLYPGLTLDASIGSKYRIDYATNVSNPTWITLTNLTVASRPYFVLDPQPATAPRRFYRAILLP